MSVNIDEGRGGKKFALIGTSSSGKTTLAFSIVAKLKELGVLVDGVLQQDRRIAFDRDRLETHKEAQYWVIFNQLIKECELQLKRGTDVLVSDRSVLDFYAYYETMYGRDNCLLDYIWHWCASYTCLYYLEPLLYQDDGARPSDNFRMKVDVTLKKIISEAVPANVKIRKIARESIMPDILSQIDRILTKAELDILPVVLEQDCLVGGSYAFNRQTKFSDVDIYLRGSTFLNESPELEKRLQGTFGARFQIKTVTAPVWEYLKTQGFILLSYLKS